MGKKAASGRVPQTIPECAKSAMSTAVVNRLGKRRTILWPAAVAEAQGQGLGTCSAGSSKV